MIDKDRLMEWLDNKMERMGSPEAYSYQVGIYHGYKAVREQIELGIFDKLEVAK